MIERILALGNSLTCHGPSTDALGWQGNWGMAATSQDKDYAHQLLRLISESQNNNTPVIEIGSLLATNWNRTKWDTWAEFNPDIAIIQTGDNLPEEQTTVTSFFQPYLELITCLEKKSPRIHIICTSLWGDSPKRNQIIERVCRATHSSFADLRPIAADPRNRATDENIFQNKDIRWHPGDRGMQAIAQKLCGIIQLHH